MSGSANSTMSYTSFSDGDIVVRSSDGFSLHLHQVFLSLASPYFRSIISNLEKGRTNVPTIALEERASTIDFLLQFVYPKCTKRQPSTLNEAVTVYRAAMRMEIEPAISTTLGYLSQHLEKESNHLRAWATAMSLDLNDQRSESCKRLLASHIDDFNRCVKESPMELAEVSGLQLSYLLSWYTGETRSVLPRSIRAWVPNMTTKGPNIYSEAKPSAVIFPAQPSSDAKFIFHSDGDTILSSYDGADFCLHSIVISHSSTILKQDIDAAVSTHGLKRVHMSESGETLNILARFMYPTARPAPISSLDSLITALTAARRFKIQIAITVLMERLEKALGAFPNPLRAWAVARSAGADSARSSAALRCLRAGNNSMNKYLSESPAELAKVTGLQLIQLLSWRLSTRDEAYAIVIGTSLRSRYPRFYESSNHATTCDTIVEMLLQRHDELERYLGNNPWQWAQNDLSDDEACKSLEGFSLEVGFAGELGFDRTSLNDALNRHYQKQQDRLALLAYDDELS